MWKSTSGDQDRSIQPFLSLVFMVLLREALFTLGTMLQNEAVCESVCLYVRIFDDFYEGDMDPVRGLLPTGTLTKKFSH